MTCGPGMFPGPRVSGKEAVRVAVSECTGARGAEIGPRRVAGHTWCRRSRTEDAGPGHHLDMRNCYGHTYFVIFFLTKKEKIVLILDRRISLEFILFGIEFNTIRSALSGFRLD